MKKVRFESPVKFSRPKNMDNLDCHSPRPFPKRQEVSPPSMFFERTKHSESLRLDPIEDFETSNSHPYTQPNRYNLQENILCAPSQQLDISILDATPHEPRKHTYSKTTLYTPHMLNSRPTTPDLESRNQNTPNVLNSIENNAEKRVQDNSFFLRRDKLDTFSFPKSDDIHTELKNLRINKENVLSKKAEILSAGKPINHQPHFNKENMVCWSPENIVEVCPCYNCYRSMSQVKENVCNNNCPCQPLVQRHTGYHCQARDTHVTEHCNNDQNHTTNVMKKPQNAVDKKRWAIERYEQSQKQNCTEIERPTAVTKDKREPTVADLFKIIKLQNEQLQLLQQKVDRFISTNTQQQNIQTIPIQNYVSEQVTLEAVGQDHHKISIGVMTSFEMIRTSTVINKDMKQMKCHDVQVQCDPLEIDKKEKSTRTETMNFLEGLSPVAKSTQCEPQVATNLMYEKLGESEGNYVGNVGCVEKTLNEMSLYNVQVDNETTPQLSPDRSLYLDVRDYSDSNSGSDDQSNVGWTYYNKVMTHVNGMLQDSDMPSSASALFRNTRQQCLQMQIDKTNVSVTKRVKFGDDVQMQHPLVNVIAATDTSMKMNQLAAKYLNNGAHVAMRQQLTTKTTMNTEMSFATRNYMERHQILQGAPIQHVKPQGVEMPRFLDITALKQQPKLL